jgi:hypothetical protein
MSPDTKKQVVAAAIGLATGILGTYAMVWRDVAVIRSEMQHIQGDISVIQMFISNDDPRAYIAAKNAIREEHVKDEKDRGD